MECWLRVEPYEPALAILMASKRAGHSIKMRRSLARFNGPESLATREFLANVITITSGFRFPVHTSRTERGQKGSQLRTSSNHVLIFLRSRPNGWSFRNRQGRFRARPVRAPRPTSVDTATDRGRGGIRIQPRICRREGRTRPGADHLSRCIDLLSWKRSEQS
jgi:hypothetical protein